MTNVLLVAISVMVLIIMICSVITMALVVSESKKKDLIYKVIKVISIILLLVIIIGAAIGVSYVKKDDNSNSVIKENVTLENAGFNAVSVDEYISLVNGSEKSIVLVARPTCSYCELFTPILKQAMDDMKLTINYVNTDNFSNDDWTKFNNSLDYLKNENWGTPLTLIVQDGKAVAVNNGYVELNEIKNFFKDNGLGK